MNFLYLTLHHDTKTGIGTYCSVRSVVKGSFSFSQPQPPPLSLSLFIFSSEPLVLSLLGTKVNNMASRVKGLVCLWHHEHGRTYRSHDFSGGGRSRALVS